MEKGNYSLLMDQLTNTDIIKIANVIMLRKLERSEVYMVHIESVYGARESGKSAKSSFPING